MKWQFIFFYLTLLLFLAPASAELRFEGVTAYEIQQLKNRLPELNNTTPSYSTLDKAVRYLMSLGTYAKVSIYSESKDKRVLSAIPLKKLIQIKITGNKAYDKDDILTAMGLKTGNTLDTGKVAIAAEQLKEFYGQNGYLNAIVSFQFEEATSSNLNLLVNIKEREPCTIQKFTFLTENQKLADRLRSNVRRQMGKNFSEDNLILAEQNMDEYLKKNRYLNAQVRQLEAKYNKNKTAVELIYEITDPYAFELIIKNTASAKEPRSHLAPHGEEIKPGLTSGQVLNALRLEEFPRGSLDPARDINLRVRDHYVTQGFPHVRTQFKETISKEQYKKTIVIDIDEGPRVRIKDIEVVGRISRPSIYYAKIIQKNSSDVVDRGFFNRDDLENGVTNLITDLNNEGYLRARSQSLRIEYSANKEQATIVVLLDEGPLTQLTKISIAGNLSFTESQLLSLLSISSQSALRLNQLEESVEKIKSFYRSRGFLEMRIKNEDIDLIRYEESALHAHVHFDIHEGPQIFIRRVVVDGNIFTKDYVVLKEANLEAGDLLTPELIEESTRRLNKLGIFSRVDVRTLEANTDVSHRTLVINVTERNPGLFRMGVGLTNKRELTARGFGGISYINLGGAARAISLRGTVESSLIEENYLEYEVTAGYLEPFLFDSKFRGRVNLSRSEKVAEVLKEGDTDVLKIRTTDRITFAVERDITSKIKFTWLAWGMDSTVQFLAPNPLSIDSTRLDIAYIGPSIDIDYRDNPFLPTMGTFTKLDTEYAAPFLGSSQLVEFVRTQGTFTHYQRVFSSPRWVWANSVRGGYVNNLSDKDGSGVPISYAFFLGDFATIRGYSGTRLDRIPNDREFPISDTDQIIIPDESTYYLLKSELRFPLGSGPFGGVLFYDAGEVGIQGYNFEDPFKQSFGLGLRINTPVGPISLDYARKISPDELESPDHWHLFIGTF